MSQNTHWTNTKFAKPGKPRTNWNNYATAAENERRVMIAEFHAWAVKKRHECETQLILSESQMVECAPYCRAGLDRSTSPADVPSVVFEFTLISLDVIRLKQELELLNVYYSLAARNGHCTVFMEVPPSDVAEMSQLWAMFLSDEKDGE